jgi:hypothetical protein
MLTGDDLIELRPMLGFQRSGTSSGVASMSGGATLAPISMMARLILCVAFERCRVGDRAAKHEALVEFLLITEAANLPHERAQLARQLRRT